jgi:O-antigen/teichoic acid export membrane protein
MLAVMMVAARGLSTPQFALMASAIALATVLTAALDLGSQTLLTRDGVAGPQARGGLLQALALARAPLLFVVLIAAAVIGGFTGHLLEALATVLIAVAGAIQLSVTGALRSAQDLLPEAVAKLLTGVLTLIAAGVCVALAPQAATMLVALGAATLLALAPMTKAARATISRGPVPPPLGALRRAAPLGAMALATLAYYRSGTIALSLLSTAGQTARFAAASTVAWGLLCVANAVTTGLLPSIAAADTPAAGATITRRWLIRTTSLAGILAALVALGARPVLVLIFGTRYGSAAGVLAILAGATVLIAPAGVLGTALIAAGRLRPLGVQVAASLAVNVAVLVLFVPALGAWGAAAATVACETVALAILVRSAIRSVPALVPQLRPASPLIASVRPLRTPR